MSGFPFLPKALFLLGASGLWSVPIFCFDNLPRPDINLEFEDPRVRMISGIRPYRKGGIRMDRQLLESGAIVWHNYGHGGGGITLSWGSVREVLRDATGDLATSSRVVVWGQESLA